MHEQRIAAFGPFTFNPSLGELRRDGQLVSLAPREGALLEHLIRHSDQVVPREQILAAVWGNAGRVAADTRLNTCVRRLRNALGDDSKSPQYVATVHRRGYRFLAQVHWEDEGSVAPATRPATRWAPVLAGTVALVGMVALVFLPDSNTGAVPADLESTYLRGRHLATQGSLRDARSGHDLLVDFADVAPTVSGAWSALAVASARLGDYAEAESHAQTALDLTSQSAEAHTVLAETAIALRWDFEEAEAHVLRAIALDPRSPHAHSTYAFTLALRGRWDQALSQARHALALDPLRTLSANDLAYFLYWAGLDEDAVEQARKILTVEPDLPSALGVLRLGLLSLGDTTSAAAPTIRLIELGRDEALQSAARGADPSELQTLYLRWRTTRSVRVSMPDRWVQLAAAQAELGNLPAALEAAHNALAERAPALPMLLVDPRFEALNRSGALAAIENAVRGAG